MDNRSQMPIQFSSSDRNIIAGMYYKFILQSVGGSEDFEKKQQYCCDQLRIHHCLSSEREIATLHVRRNDMLKTVSLKNVAVFAESTVY